MKDEFKALTKDALKMRKAEEKEEKVKKKQLDAARRHFHEQQCEKATKSMLEWLIGGENYGKSPSLSLEGEFDLFQLHYYYFKFRKGIGSKWFLCVCGGFTPDSLQHNGYLYAEEKIFDAKSAKAQAMTMIQNLRSYRARQPIEDLNDGVVDKSVRRHKKE